VIELFSPLKAKKQQREVHQEAESLRGASRITSTMGIMATKEDGECREIRKLKEKVNVSLQMDASAVENSLSGCR
jgi:hypothetical protein